MTAKPATWFGVYTEAGKLVDVTPSEFHAQEIANTLTKERHRKHVVLPVIVTPVTA